MNQDIIRRAKAHYGSIRAELLRAEARHGADRLKPLHEALGRAWDAFREVFPDEGLRTMSGGTDKPDPNEPPPGEPEPPPPPPPPPGE